MKKNKTMRLASGLLVAVLLTTCAISGTFAKYTSEFSGSDAARVAKFTVDSTADEFAIFDVSKIYDTKDDTNYTVKADDADVKNGTTDGIIAPGTWGEFTFNVSDSSEVTVNYAIDYTVNEAGVPLVWSVDGGTAWTEDLADVDATVLSGSKDITVMWKWVYEDGTAATDTADTALGVVGTAAPTVGIKVTFTQVD